VRRFTDGAGVLPTTMIRNLNGERNALENWRGAQLR